MADAPLLECIGVSKSFGAVQALYQVDFEVRSGEVMALRRRQRCRQVDADQEHRRHPSVRHEGEVRFEGRTGTDPRSA